MRAALLRAAASIGTVCVACADAGSEPSREAGAADAGQDAGNAEGEDAALGPRALVHGALWESVPWGEDPFDPSAGAEPPPACAQGAFGEEHLGGELVFFVRTEQCPSLTVRQASRNALRAGDTLQIRVYHFALTAPVDASARLIVQLGETRVWERELPIPSPAAELVEQWEAAEDYPAGTPVLFHVNNHGNNEYTLVGVDLL
jgi:hypothetical protein